MAGYKHHTKIKKYSIPFVGIYLCLVLWFAQNFGQSFFPIMGKYLLTDVCNLVSSLFVPSIRYAEFNQQEEMYVDISQLVFPWYKTQMQTVWMEEISNREEDSGVYAALAAKENEQVEMFLNEYLVEENGEQDEKQFPLEVMQEVHEVHETQEQESPVETEKTIALKQEEQAISWVRQVNINRKKLEEFDYLRQNFYQVDSSTTTDKEQLNIKKWMDKDLTLKESKGDEPQILIYHTHSQEAYKDSKKGDASMTVVGVGAYLTKLLRETYGLKVMHHTGEYDVGDRDHAYSNAAPALKKILEEHPSIQMVIDVHRDGVAEKTHLVTTLNGKPTAKLMFFNGLCRTATRGKLTSLTNPYIEENLAFSFRMQLMANEYFPGLTRKIYLKGYRYNMHYRPYSMLVEVGAQTNTFAEAKNAMEPLAALLAHTVKGE